MIITKWMFNIPHIFRRYDFEIIYVLFYIQKFSSLMFFNITLFDNIYQI